MLFAYCIWQAFRVGRRFTADLSLCSGSSGNDMEAAMESRGTEPSPFPELLPYTARLAHAATKIVSKSDENLFLAFQ
jgi:hypothetical protein